MNLLLYAPELNGHPQLYCRNLVDLLTEAGHQVIIAAGTDERTWAKDWRDLRPLAASAKVCLVDTRKFSRAGQVHLRAEELIDLQTAFRIESTLLIEGNYLEDDFCRIAEKTAPRFKGRMAVIMPGACRWIVGEDPYTGLRDPIWPRSFRNLLGRVKRTFVPRRDTPRYLYEKVLIGARVVDAIVVKDERATERFGPPVFWMPEIYKVFNPRPTEVYQDDWHALAAPIRDFCDRAGADNLVLYFGTGTWYKGYDYFLRLLELDPTSYGLHAGAPDRRERGKTMVFDTERLRKKLLEEGRLFEANRFIESDALVRDVFSRISRFVSTHRLTLSSGTALQALDAGKPVLMPSRGLVGYRVRQNKIGKTYEYLDDKDLVRCWKEFRETPVDAFSEGIAAFMERFSYEKISEFFLRLLTA